MKASVEMDCNLYLLNATSHIASLLSSVTNQQPHGAPALPADLNQGRTASIDQNQNQSGAEFLSADTFRDPPTTVKLSENPPLGTSRYILQCLAGVVIPIAVLGILGNLLNIFVLTRKQLLNTMDRMEKSVNVGLVALAVSDLLFCLLFLAASSPDKAVYSPIEYSVLQYFRLYQVVQYVHVLVTCMCVRVCVWTIKWKCSLPDIVVSEVMSNICNVFFLFHLPLLLGFEHDTRRMHDSLNPSLSLWLCSAVYKLLPSSSPPPLLTPSSSSSASFLSTRKLCWTYHNSPVPGWP